LPALVPGRVPGTPRPTRSERAHYNGSYHVTAAFLAFLTEKYDRELGRKLNAVMREGKYKNEGFKELTGKTLQQLDEEWRASLPGRRRCGLGAARFTTPQGGLTR